MSFEDEIFLNDEFEDLNNQYFDDFEGEGDFDSFDSHLNEIDFSNLSGDFKQRFSSVKRQLSKKSALLQKNSNLKRKFSTRKEHEIPVTKKRTVLKGNNPKKISRVLVPRNKKVIVQGVSQFIIDEGGKNDAIKKVGYYKGEKLKELVLIFNNNSAIDFNLELFNPSMMIDYLYSTSLNLNDKVTVSGGTVSYSDVLFNLLANPALIANCKFVFDGPSVVNQMSIPLKFKNKDIQGIQKVLPMSLALKMDNMQVANNIVFFDMTEALNRPFIPDGMDVIEYTVLAGNTVTMSFFYKQKNLKKLLFKEAKDSKGLL